MDAGVLGLGVSQPTAEWAVPVAAAVGIALVCYLGLLAYSFLRARAGFQLFLYVRREVDQMRQAKKKGESVEMLPAWEEMEKLLADVLRAERILKEKKAGPAS